MDSETRDHQARILLSYQSEDNAETQGDYNPLKLLGSKNQTSLVDKNITNSAYNPLTLHHSNVPTLPFKTAHESKSIEEEEEDDKEKIVRADDTMHDNNALSNPLMLSFDPSPNLIAPIPHSATENISPKPLTESAEIVVVKPVPLSVSVTNQSGNSTDVIHDSTLNRHQHMGYSVDSNNGPQDDYEPLEENYFMSQYLRSKHFVPEEVEAKLDQPEELEDLEPNQSEGLNQLHLRSYHSDRSNHSASENKYENKHEPDDVSVLTDATYKKTDSIAEGGPVGIKSHLYNIKTDPKMSADFFRDLHQDIHANESFAFIRTIDEPNTSPIVSPIVGSTPLQSPARHSKPNLSMLKVGGHKGSSSSVSSDEDASHMSRYEHRYRDRRKKKALDEDSKVEKVAVKHVSAMVEEYGQFLRIFRGKVRGWQAVNDSQVNAIRVGNSSAGDQSILVAIFEEVDENKNGKISPYELRVFLELLADDLDMVDALNAKLHDEKSPSSFPGNQRSEHSYLEVLMDQIDMTRSEILLIDIERVFFPEKNKEKHQGAGLKPNKLSMMNLDNLDVEVGLIVYLTREAIKRELGKISSAFDTDSALLDAFLKLVKVTHAGRGGTIQMRHIQKFLQSVKVDEIGVLSEMQVDIVLHSMDSNGDGVWSAKEIREWIFHDYGKGRELEEVEVMEQVIDLINTNYNGDAKQLYERIDSHKKNYVVYTEFISNLRILGCKFSHAEGLERGKVMKDKTRHCVTVESFSQAVEERRKALGSSRKPTGDTATHSPLYSCRNLDGLTQPSTELISVSHDQGFFDISMSRPSPLAVSTKKLAFSPSVKLKSTIVTSSPSREGKTSPTVRQIVKLTRGSHGRHLGGVAAGIDESTLKKYGYGHHFGKWRGFPFDSWSCCDTNEKLCPQRNRKHKIELEDTNTMAVSTKDRRPLLERGISLNVSRIKQADQSRTSSSRRSKRITPEDRNSVTKEYLKRNKNYVNRLSINSSSSRSFDQSVPSSNMKSSRNTEISMSNNDHNLKPYRFTGESTSVRSRKPGIQANENIFTTVKEPPTFSERVMVEEFSHQNVPVHRRNMKMSSSVNTAASEVSSAVPLQSSNVNSSKPFPQHSRFDEELPTEESVTYAPVPEKKPVEKLVPAVQETPTLSKSTPQVDSDPYPAVHSATTDDEYDARPLKPHIASLAHELQRETRQLLGRKPVLSPHVIDQYRHVFARSLAVSDTMPRWKPTSSQPSYQSHDAHTNPHTSIKTNIRRSASNDSRAYFRSHSRDRMSWYNQRKALLYARSDLYNQGLAFEQSLQRIERQVGELVRRDSTLQEQYTRSNERLRKMKQRLQQVEEFTLLHALPIVLSRSHQLLPDTQSPIRNDAASVSRSPPRVKEVDHEQSSVNSQRDNTSCSHVERSANVSIQKFSDSPQYEINRETPFAEVDHDHTQMTDHSPTNHPQPHVSDSSFHSTSDHQHSGPETVSRNSFDQTDTLGDLDYQMRQRLQENASIREQIMAEVREALGDIKNIPYLCPTPIANLSPTRVIDRHSPFSNFHAHPRPHSYAPHTRERRLSDKQRYYRPTSPTAADLTRKMAWIPPNHSGLLSEPNIPYIEEHYLAPPEQFGFNDWSEYYSVARQYWSDLSFEDRNHVAVHDWIAQKGSNSMTHNPYRLRRTKFENAYSGSTRGIVMEKVGKMESIAPNMSKNVRVYPRDRDAGIYPVYRHNPLPQSVTSLERHRKIIQNSFGFERSSEVKPIVVNDTQYVVKQKSPSQRTFKSSPPRRFRSSPPRTHEALIHQDEPRRMHHGHHHQSVESYDDWWHQIMEKKKLAEERGFYS